MSVSLSDERAIAGPAADRYVSAPEGEQESGVATWTIRAWAKEGRIGVRELPGAKIRYRLADIFAVLEASTRPAALSPGAAGRNGK
jgi:hypothetical protein